MAENGELRPQDRPEGGRRPPVRAVKIRGLMRMWSRFTVDLEQMERGNAARRDLGRPPRWGHEQMRATRLEISTLGRTIREWLAEYEEAR